MEFDPTQANAWHIWRFLMESKNSQTLRQKTEFLALRGFRVTFSWIYIIVVSFIRITFVIVKLKVFKKFCVPIQHPWNGTLWEAFGLLLFQIWSSIAEILTRGSTLANKNTILKKFEGIEFSLKRDGPKVCTFPPFVCPWRWPK